MKKIAIIALLLLLGSTLMAQEFAPDILGEPFEALTIEQPDAYDGEVVTTIVRHAPLEGITRGVLYVHGYNDYFFQVEMAEQFTSHGWQFYAVDLRRYGRSLREWQVPFAVRDLSEYFADIDAAIEVMHSEGIDQIVLMGHSTGGLTTPLYCHSKGDELAVEALILNSPFLDMNLGGGFMEGVGVPTVSLLGALFPSWEVMGGSSEPGGYGRSVSAEWDGEWQIDHTLKRVESLPITAGWLRAIHRGQRTLQRGVDIECPILVLYSDNTIWDDYSEELYKSGDSVLDVVDIAQYAPSLGRNVTQIEVKGGMHDLVLSPAAVRYPLYETLFSVLAGWGY